MLIQKSLLRKLFVLEVKKVMQRRFSLYLLLFNMIGLPLVVSGIILFIRDGSEGSYIEDAALSILSFSLSYIFLPLWVIILVGFEIKSGHSHRVVFLTSRTTFLVSKIVFCGLTAFMYSLIGLMTLAILDVFSPFPTINIQSVFYFKFFMQCFLVFLCYSIFLAGIVVLVGHAFGVYAGYFLWVFIENTTYRIFEKAGTKLWFLPVHLFNGLFVVDGEPKLGNYYIFFDTPDFENLGIIAAIMIILLFIVHRKFSKTSLTPLSD